MQSARRSLWQSMDSIVWRDSVGEMHMKLCVAEVKIKLYFGGSNYQMSCEKASFYRLDVTTLCNLM